MKVEYALVSAPFVEGEPTEDAYVVDSAGGGRPFFAAIADGHGREIDRQGKYLRKSVTIARFAQRVAESLSEQFARFPDPALFPEIFNTVAQCVDTQFRPLTVSRHQFVSLDVGAVAICLTVVDEKIHLAQAGDCRLYVGSDTHEGFTLLTRDHGADNADELARLHPLFQAGTFALWPAHTEGQSVVESPRKRRLCRFVGGRLTGGLLPTRTFGDWEYQPAVTHEPEVKTFELSAVPEGTLFALCSDGGNRSVERVLEHFRGRHRQVELSEVVQQTRPHLATPADDVTIIYFRVTH